MSSEIETDDFNRADKLYDERRFDEAFRIFMTMARNGDVVGMERVAYMYDSGEGVRRSRGRSIVWDRRAYASGSRIAAFNLGVTYRSMGDIRKSAHWFEKALAAGEKSAALQLAKMYMISELEIGRAKKYLQIITACTRGVEVSPADFEEAENLLTELATSNPNV